MSRLVPASPTRRGAGLIVLDVNEEIAVVLEPLVRDLGGRLEVGPAAADAVDLGVRAGEKNAIPELVILAGDSLSHRARWVTWRGLGIPHLAIEWDRRHVSVGPVVVPGSACLGCLALHRHDVRRRDPAALARTLTRPRTQPRREDDSDLVLTTLGAGVAALLARNVVLHRRYLPGLTLEVHLPDPQIATRRWALHPRCDGHDIGVRMAQ